MDVISSSMFLPPSDVEESFPFTQDDLDGFSLSPCFESQTDSDFTVDGQPSLTDPQPTNRQQESYPTLSHAIRQTLSSSQQPSSKLIQLLNRMGGQSLRTLCEYFILLFLDSSREPQLLGDKEEVAIEFLAALQETSLDLTGRECKDQIDQRQLDAMVSGQSVSLDYDEHHRMPPVEGPADVDPVEYLKKQIYPTQTVVRSRDTKSLPHRYITPKLFGSKPVYNGKTYCDIKKCKEIRIPPDTLGWIDTKNHSFLIHKGVDNSVLAGKRLTINKLTDTQFAFLAMQIASKRGSSAPDPTVPPDPAFDNLTQIVKGQKSTKRLLYGPSNMEDRQQRELLYSYIRLHILKENPALHEEIQRYYFFAGSYVTHTKYGGWTQNPDEAIYGLQLADKRTTVAQST